MIYLAIGRFIEAHEHLDHAQRLLSDLKDSVHLAQVNETRAKVLLAEGRNAEAEKIISAAVQVLDKGDEQSLLAEALTTHGVALARVGKHVRARLTLQRAIIVAEQAGDLEAAGRAALTIIEELSEHATRAELLTLYEQAADSLANAQQPNIPARLIAGVRLVLRAFRTAPASNESRAEEFKPPISWKDFSFKKEIKRYERFLIERALRESSGIVTRAARLLGFRHHQSLISLLNNRHKDLLSIRTPIVNRKSTIIRDSPTPPDRPTDRQTRPITILHVEDSKEVAEVITDTLEMEGWKTVICTDGAKAKKKIASEANYDLLLLDNDLPNMSGIDLANFARSLRHRKQTPIILLSASDCEKEARRAGVNAFLRKPEDVLAIVETIARLLASTPRRR